MHDTSSLLDAAKSHLTPPSDYNLAKTLGVDRTRISGYRTGKSRPDDTTAQKIAELAGLDEGYVVACLHAERAQTPEQKAVWLRIAERLKKGVGTTLAAAIFSVGFGGSPDAEARALTPADAGALTHASAIHSLYIVARRRVMAFLKRIARFGDAPSRFALA